MLNDVQKAKALFFDFDGTLVDSLPVLRKVYMDFLEKMGHEGTEEEFQRLNGPSINEIISYLKEKYQLEDSVESMKEMFHHLFKGIYSKQVHFFPGVLEFLNYAKSKGYRIFVVTSAEPIMVSSVFERYQVDDVLDGIISSKEFTNGKPHPEVYLQALKRADLHADEVVAFEDSENGILASTRAGIKTFAFGKEESLSPEVTPVKDWKEVMEAFTLGAHG
ncbi:MAG: Phosphorylated carbohydrates phosphatase [Chlamydiae bacterium]|nr:Phosphorylated carbohydrates phosphatase [Chlamydiota bacterium]